MNEADRTPNGRQLGRLYGQLDDIESLLLFYADAAALSGGAAHPALSETARIVGDAIDSLQDAIDIVNKRPE